MVCVCGPLTVYFLKAVWMVLAALISSCCSRSTIHRQGGREGRGRGRRGEGEGGGGGEVGGEKGIHRYLVHLFSF